MRLIDADALIAEYDRVHTGKPGGARKLMVDAPTVEERKTGEWKKVSASRYMTRVRYAYKCSVCGDIYDLYSNYCPNCGAYMRGER